MSALPPKRDDAALLRALALQLAQRREASDRRDTWESAAEILPRVLEELERRQPQHAQREAP